MSITANDHRRYADSKLAEEAALAAEAPGAPLMGQAASAEATTGDDRLDKMVRAMQALIDALALKTADIAVKAMGAPTHDMVTMCQREYWYNKGKQDTLLELVKLPAQIIMEEKPVLHSV